MRGRAARLGTVAAVLGILVACGAPLCPFAIVTRHPCPGCGLTRATLALAQGHLADALRLHPLSPVMAPLVIAALAYNAAIYVKDGRIAAAEGMQGAWVTRLGIALAILMLTVWIARFFGAFGGPVPV
ncbi:DUF2752 domain-containing protein [Sorangium atrum]|uniref:DUF2752 domain-containing protein n=1 Tax=Sorangium atrum TaxID=2995308 RepID=A0ABT5BTL4_9BACT|nr:DUF2752 domain-containing protein [Sorangium aterium]MDC0676312.1 DUF2752 domain-containing protein [Sorangium aterium]